MINPPPSTLGHVIRPLPTSSLTWNVTKIFGAERGFSTAFRQWRADSHCHFIHGYALSFSLTFAGFKLDHRNWLIDFGEFSHVKNFLGQWFDHTTVVAMDDPHFAEFCVLHNLNVIDGRVLPNVGVEAFAEFVAKDVDKWLIEKGMSDVYLKEVKVSEHPANSASWVNHEKQLHENF